MVDFQSRDTRRAPTSDDEEEDAASEDPGEADAADQSGDDGATGRSATADAENGSGGGLPYAVVRVTAEGDVEDDDAVDAVLDELERGERTVATRELVRPDYDGLQNVAVTLADREDVRAIVFVGGTGVEPSDLTVDALEPLFDKQLPGFGELFRRFATDAVGTAAVGTRATAGIVDRKPVFLVPGEAEAARMGVDRLVCPEAPGLARDARER